MELLDLVVYTLARILLRFSWLDIEEAVVDL